jgi:hypothetical protein
MIKYKNMFGSLPTLLPDYFRIPEFSEENICWDYYEYVMENPLYRDTDAQTNYLLNKNKRAINRDIKSMLAMLKNSVSDTGQQISELPLDLINKIINMPGFDEYVKP